MENNLLLEVKDLSVKLKNTKKMIVDNVSFQVRQGRTLCVIGESGSGKTMTSKAIMHLLNPNIFEISGNILFNGSNITQLKDREFRKVRGKEIAMIMQNPMTAFAPMTRIGKQVTDTLTVHLGISKTKAYEQSVLGMQKLNLPQAEKIMHSYPHELSGGMLQRVMIAMTLLLKPKLIIADEATTAVDVISERLILDEFKFIKEQGISLIVVTHDFGVAAMLGDDLVVMRNSVILEQGTVKSVLSSPQNPYTKELIDASILTKNDFLEGVKYA